MSSIMMRYLSLFGSFCRIKSANCPKYQGSMTYPSPYGGNGRSVLRNKVLSHRIFETLSPIEVYGMHL